MPRKATKTKVSNNKRRAGLPVNQNKRGYNLQAASYVSKIENNLQDQSKLSIVLGGLIVLVVGILIFNYFNKGKNDLGPAQQTQQETSSENSVGKYTVKEGDTLFTIADQYYKNGDKFTEIAQANKLENADIIETGQVLEIPKVENVAPNAPNTEWGAAILGNTYTVQDGDWLSTIAGRAYGDILAFEKIAKANNISNPDLIEPGTVLTIPR